MRPVVLNKHSHHRRTGFSLLELLVTVTIMATLMSSVFVLLRTGRSAWEANDTDQTRLEAAHAVMRHIVRHVRQSEEVTAISSSFDNSGTLSVLMPSGEIYVWDHAAGLVSFGINSADDLLGENITELNFIGYEADGTTTTTTVADIQSILATVTVTLPRNTGATQIVQCWIWKRSW